MSRIGIPLLALALFHPGMLSAQDVIPPKVTGVVKKLDIEVGTITVRPTRKGALEDETFSLLKKDIDVIAPSKETVKLDAVVVGQTVHLKLDAAGDVEAITIQAHTFLATIADVDFNKRIITLAEQQDRSRIMAVAADAPISMAGRSAYLREVKPGSQMNVTASLDGNKALALSLVSDPDGKLASKLFTRVKTSRLPGTRLVGQLTEVNAAKGELQLTGPKTKGLPRTMPLAKEAVIQLIYGQVAVQKLALKQVPRLAQATVAVSILDHQVTHVLLTASAVRAKVKTLDAERGYVTVEIDGRDKTFALRSDVKVMDKTRVRRLVDLQVNMAVGLVLSLDRQELLAIDIQRLGV
jgi:hypothetical protein